MSFQPEKITRLHVLKAFKDIDDEVIGKRPSTKFDVLFDGKTYPPKDVMRQAHKYATGEYLWYPGGGEPTNKYLEALGFDIVLKLDNSETIKIAFASWLEKNSPQSYRQYIGKNENTILKRLNEIESFFSEHQIFNVDKNNYSTIKQYLIEEVSIEKRKNNQEFFDYDNNKGSGIPKALIGKKGYIKFLDFYFNIPLFTWVKTHKELVTYLSTKEPSQDELIELLQSVGITEFNDKEADGNLIELTEIDPFTFFCYIYKYGSKKRLLFLQEIAGKLNLTVPTDDYGIPSANAQKVWLFPYLGSRSNNEMQRLWNFFHSAVSNKITDEQFYDVLQIKNTGKTKLTEGLFNVNPEKYFPLNGPTKPYLKELFEINPEFNTYTEYLNVLEKLKEKTDKPFYELSYDAWLWNDKRNKTNVWIFQGNPKFYDVVGALQEDVLTTWKVAAHKDKIKDGDKVILWLTGDNSGCYALAKVTSEVGKIPMSEEENKYYKSDYDENEDRVSIVIEHNLAEEPILWEEIKQLPELSELKVGNQGTNFSATVDQYNTIKNLISFENDNFEIVLQRFNQEDLKSYFTLLFEILDTANLKKGDSRMLFSYGNTRLSFTAGQRIALVLRNINSSEKFLILSKGKLNESSSPFAAKTPVLYATNIDNLELNNNEKQSVFEGIEYELNRVKSSGYRNKNYSDFENAVFDPDFRSRFQQQKNEKMKNEPNLNQILFGPPGTGKTFNTINEALKIVDPLYYNENQKDRKKLTERFKELLIKNTEENKGQIAFCTFHQSFSYEDFVEGIKPKTTETKSVYYDTEPGVFKRICQLADSNNSTVKVIKEGKLSWNEEQFKKASFYKLSLGTYNNPNDRPIYEYCRDNGYIAIGFGQENDFTGLNESEIVEKCNDLKLEDPAAQQLNYFIHYLKKGNYVIIGNGNKYVRAIGKVTGDYEYMAESPIRYNHFRKVEWIFVDENIPIEAIYKRGLSQKTMYKIDETALKLDFFTNKGQQQVIEAKEDKKFVLIIDEINRGNVSSIFGELITLIEKDKRAGCNEELEVTLPYSKEPFKVPNNVYLIGTMNTADRSIEALDTALRRRFSFKEFPPKSYLIKTEGASGKVNGKVDNVDLEELLKTINTRIEKLIDKDHRIGHSYFLKVDSSPKLIHAFKNEIIPLLEEYFFGDYGKIGLVLGASFVEKVNHNFSFAEFSAYDTDIQSDLKEKAVFRIKEESEWDFSKI